MSEIVQTASHNDEQKHDFVCGGFIFEFVLGFMECLESVEDGVDASELKVSLGGGHNVVQMLCRTAREILRVFEAQITNAAPSVIKLAKVAAYKTFVYVYTHKSKLKPVDLAKAVIWNHRSDVEDDVFMKPGLYDEQSEKYYTHNGSDALNYGYRLLFEEETVPVDWVHEVKPSGRMYTYTFEEEFLLTVAEQIFDEIMVERNENSKEVVAMNNLIELMQKQAEAVVKMSEKVSAIKAGIEILEELPDPRRVFNVSAHVRFFTGRQRELDQIHEHLQQGERCITLSQAATVTGLGGVGKSELARKYAYKYFSEESHNAVWIVAEDAKKLEASFHEVAKTLEIPIMERVNDREQFRSIDSIALDVYPYISNERSLVIFDNVDDYEIIRDLLPWSLYPTQISPFVLITSRKQFGNVERGVSIRTLELNEFSPEEALEFIKKSLGINLEDTSHDGDIETLADRLMFFPLALSQAVAYIRKQRFDIKNYSIKDYIQDYDDEEKKGHLLQHKHKYDRYERVLYTTWSITFDKIAAVPIFGAKALDIINAMAYLAPDDIPVMGFFRSQGELEDDFWSAVDLLDQYAIIRLEQGKSSVHRLVQEVLRLWHKSHEEEIVMIEKALNIKHMYWYSHQSHAAAVWDYAYKYESLFENFFASVSKDDVVNILVHVDHAKALTSIFRFFKTQNVDTAFMIQKYFPDAVIRGCIDVLKLFKPNDMRLMFHAEVGAALKTKSLTSLENFIAHLPPNEQHLINSKFQDVSALFFAARDGNFVVFQYLLEKGVQVRTDERNKHGETMLHAVAGRGNIDLGKWLIENKFDVNAISEMGKTPLHSAIVGKQYPFAKFLVENGANVNALNRDERSPLGEACLQTKTDMVEYLISKGADCKSQTSYGDSPLSLTLNPLQSDVTKIVRLLLEHGADSNQRFRTGEYPLHVSAQRGYLEAVKLLIHHKADPNALNKKNETALFNACRRGFPKIVEFLVESGTDANLLNSDGVSPLGEAARSGNHSIVNLLIQCGVDINVMTKRRQTPLILATCACQTEIVQALVKAGAKIDFADENKNTPLHLACRRGFNKIVSILLENGADCNRWNNFGYTPLHLAMYALDNKPPQSNVYCKGHEEYGQFLTKHQTSCYFSQFGDNDPIHYMTMKYVHCYVPTLYNPELKKITKANIRPNAIRIIRMLLHNGADVNANGRQNFTPLHYAAFKGYLDVVQILLDAKANCNVTDVRGDTPLHLAAKMNRLAVVKRLVESGADIHLPNLKGETASCLAAANGHDRVYQHLQMCNQEVTSYP